MLRTKLMVEKIEEMCSACGFTGYILDNAALVFYHLLAPSSSDFKINNRDINEE